MKARTNILIVMILLLTLAVAKTSKCQTPSFDSYISIGDTICSDDTLSPFNGETVYGLGLTADIELFSVTSYVRIIVSDVTGLEFVIYESYTMIDTIWDFSINQDSYETSFLDEFQPDQLIIQAKDASIHIDQVDMATQFVSDASSLQMQSKQSRELEKIDEINAYIQSNDLKWVAGESALCLMYYHQKKEYFGPKYQPIGFEYYVGGFFSPFYAGSYIHADPTYDIVQTFDWRNRHDANRNGSQYFDGDELHRSGWMTDIKCQAGCWVNDEWVCPDDIAPWDWPGYCVDPPPLGLGGDYRESNLCAVFSALGAIEGLLNIYYNFHYDYDLSEQQMHADGVGDECWINHGYVELNLEYIKDHGVVEENCFEFEGSPDPIVCDLCTEGTYQRAYIQSQVTVDGDTYTTEELKRDLIAYGPQIWSVIWPGFDEHAMVLVGYSIIHEGDVLFGGLDPIPPGDEAIGKTYWIFRDSHGFFTTHQNGYIYLLLTEDPGLIHKIYNPSTWALDPDNDRLCLDEDLDGYFNWGIDSKPGNCPSCPDEMDGNDNDASLGPLDDDGFITIINSYNMSFEDGFGSWRQSGNDDVDFEIHSGYFINNGWAGPSGAQDGDKYLYFKGDEGFQYNIDAILESPHIEFDIQCSYSMSFYYCISRAGGQTDGRAMKVETSSDNGLTWQTAWEAPLNGEHGWQEVSLLLLPGTNKIRFYTKSGEAFSWNSDMGIDNISIYEQEGPEDLILSGDYEINYEYYACGDIIIEPNSSLTVTPNGIIHMDLGKKITVKRTGELIVNGGKITDAGNGMWEGVEVWGENGSPFNVSYQGRAYLHSDAILENAKCGIKNTRTEVNDGVHHVYEEYSGGIVSAGRATFKNNEISIEYYPYGPYPITSGFSKTTFEVDDNIYLSAEVDQFIKLSGINTLSFKGTHFQDLRTGILPEERPIGIYARNASFKLEKICETYAYPCQNYLYPEFHNFNYGIKTLGIQSSSIVTVRDAIFQNCVKGMYGAGLDNISVVYSDFETHPLASPTFTSYGLYLEGCTGYAIEENTFHNDQSQICGIGLVIYNSGSDPNEVYLNSFENLEYAALAQGWNAGEETGLQFLCNHFDNCGKDIVVTGAGVPEGGGISIAPSQGAFSSNPEYMAGNVFFYNSIPDDFDDLYNEGRHFNYYFANEDGTWDSEPMDANFGERITKYGLWTEDDWDYVLHCESNQSGGGTGGGSPESLNTSEVLAEISANQSIIDSTQNVLETNIDGGDTPGSTLDVILSTPPESMDVYNDIMADVPYVSDTLVSSAIEKDNVLLNAMIRDIMVASPNTSKSEYLMDKLDDRQDPMPDYMIAEILQGNSVVDAKEGTESYLSHYLAKNNRLNNLLVRHYTWDTANYILNTDSITLVYTNDNQIHSKYKLAHHYLLNDMYQDGLNVLNDIPYDFDLDDFQTTAHQEALDYYNWLSDLVANDMSFSTLDSNQISQLWQLLDGSSVIIPVYAANILQSLDSLDYEEPIYIPDLLKSQQDYDDYNELLKKARNEYISVYPNPGKDFVIIEYSVNTPNNSVIEIVNMQGTHVYTMSLKNDRNQHLIDTRNWKNGTYVLALMVHGQIKETIKFTIIH